MWDDDHNGKADIGHTIESRSKNGYHHPWRSTAWEIHPVIKIENLDGAQRETERNQEGSSATGGRATSTTAATPSVRSAAPIEVGVITAAVTLRVPYGEVVLPVGSKVQIVSKTNKAVIIRYLDAEYALPAGSVQQ